MKKNIFVAGHNGMVGRAIVRKLETDQLNKIHIASRKEVDLLNQNAVVDYFEQNSFDEVYLAAAKVGGIYANENFPAEFIFNNLVIQNNVIDACYRNGVKKLLFLGSSCIYPKFSQQPIVEESLLSSKLEPTNEPYAIAKIAGIKLCESYNRQYGTDFRSVMPTNLYGPYDNFHDKNSHVIPGLIKRFHDAMNDGLKKINIWGTGTPLRDFLHVDDLAEACVYVMSLEKDILNKELSPMQSHINIGSGSDISISELVCNLVKISGFKGEIFWDKSKPDGTKKKLLDNTKIHKLGWSPSIDLRAGLTSTYKWFSENIDEVPQNRI